MSARFLVGLFVGVLVFHLGPSVVRLFVSYVRYQIAVMWR